MRLSLILLGLAILQGCNGQLVMYFVNALGDLLQRKGLRTPLLPDPQQQAVDENSVVAAGSGLNGDLLLDLKEQFEKLNQTFVFPTASRPIPTVGRPIALNRNANNPKEVPENTNRASSRFRFIEPLTPKNFSGLAKPTILPRIDATPMTRTINRTDLNRFARPPVVSERRIHLRPQELSSLSSRFSSLRPQPNSRLTSRTQPSRPTQPVIRPTPQSVSNIRVIQTNSNGPVRTMNSGRNGNAPAIVIVPQQAGPPGAVQPTFGGPIPNPSFNRQVGQGTASQQNGRLPNPLPPLIPPFRPPNDIPDLSIPFDSRPRPDGSVGQDPIETFLAQRNGSQEFQPRNEQPSTTLFVPPKPVQQRPVQQGSVQQPNRVVPQTGPIPNSPVQPNLQFNRRPINPNQRTPIQPQNRQPEVFNPPFPAQGVPRPTPAQNSGSNIRRRPVGNIQLPPGYKIMNTNSRNPNMQSQVPIVPNPNGQPRGNVPGFQPLTNGTIRRTQPNLDQRRARGPQLNPLQSMPLNGQARNAIPRPSVPQSPQTIPGPIQQPNSGRPVIFRRPVQQPQPTNPQQRTGQSPPQQRIPQNLPQQNLRRTVPVGPVPRMNSGPPTLMANPVPQNVTGPRNSNVPIGFQVRPGGVQGTPRAMAGPTLPTGPRPGVPLRQPTLQQNGAPQTSQAASNNVPPRFNNNGQLPPRQPQQIAPRSGPPQNVAPQNTPRNVVKPIVPQPGGSFRESLQNVQRIRSN